MTSKLTKLGIIVCLAIYLFDFFLLAKTGTLEDFGNRVESSMSWPIYGTKSVSSYLNNTQPPVKPNKSYTIAFIGDSMTDYLGDDLLKKELKVYYPSSGFALYNYGFGSSSILSVMDRLTYDTTYMGKTYPAILGQDFDLVILESFGNNPLSQYPLEEGLQKQTQELDKIVQALREKKPSSFVVFMTTISPNKFNFGKGAVQLDANQKAKWTEERVEYIKNHIQYAKDHKLPLINVFDESLGEDGTGNLAYLSPTDHIHPSPLGISFILQKVAHEIYKQRMLPL